jgi:hypothetical protein
MLLNTQPGMSPAIHQTHSPIHPSIVVLVAASLICEYDEVYLPHETIKSNGIIFKALQATVNTFRDWAMRALPHK